MGIVCTISISPEKASCTWIKDNCKKVRVPSTNYKGEEIFYEYDGLEFETLEEFMSFLGRFKQVSLYPSSPKGEEQKYWSLTISRSGNMREPSYNGLGGLAYDYVNRNASVER